MGGGLVGPGSCDVAEYPGAVMGDYGSERGHGRAGCEPRLLRAVLRRGAAEPARYFAAGLRWSSAPSSFLLPRLRLVPPFSLCAGGPAVAWQGFGLPPREGAGRAPARRPAAARPW